MSQLIRIAEGQYYEAHQQLRVIAARYSKQANWDAAVALLYEGALALLRAGQGGSGGDLGLLMVETMEKGEMEVGPETKGASPSPFREFPRPVNLKSRAVPRWTTNHATARNAHRYTGKIFAVLRAFPPAEPTRKRLVTEAIAWTAKNGEYEHGDPELHDVAGKLYAEGRRIASCFLEWTNGSKPVHRLRGLRRGTAPRAGDQGLA